MRGALDFELWDSERGVVGTVTLPAPAHWYYRWLLRFAAFLWRVVSEAELRARGLR